MSKKTKLFIVVNVDSFFLSHRLPIALAALEEGYEVTILARDTGYKEKINSYGLHFIHIPFERSGLNPLHESKCILKLARIYKKSRPDIIHHVALKACVLGSIAAKIADIKNVVNAISGLGYIFIGEKKSLKQNYIRSLVKKAIKGKAYHFIFQNPDDVREFFGSIYYDSAKVHLIKGSGVNLNIFSARGIKSSGHVRLLLHSRMLYDKGVVEFIEAARMIKDKFQDKARFILAGPCDIQNLAGIPEETLNSLTEHPYIQWIGHQDHIIPILQNADIVVLPSYREGLPKSLIEACAMGKPIITTDVPGCKECVIDGYNGYLVPKKDKVILAEKIKELIDSPEKRELMGINSRILAEQTFSIESVIQNHLSIYQTVVNS